MREDNVERKLSDLVDRLKKAFGDRLVSVILYGSGVGEDWNQDSSDLNVLCVLSVISPSELGAAEPILCWWREGNSPSPLLLTDEEVSSSTDCFPMEFHDMLHHRRVLHGADVIKDLVVDSKFYRAQVEHELRAKQLRLRQKAAEVLSQPQQLQRLMTDSVSTFCILGRHALVLHGSAPRWKKKEIVSALSGVMGIPLSGIDEILTIRAAPKRPAANQPSSLLDQYLKDISALVNFVDQLNA